METIDRKVIERVLQTLEELKADQKEISRRLIANEKLRAGSVNYIPSAGDYHRGCAHEVHGAQPEFRKGMEEGEVQLKCGHVVRTVSEAPTRIMALRAVGTAAKPHNHEHSSSMPCKMCEPPAVREKPTYPQANSEKFPVRPAMDLKPAASPDPSMVGEDRCALCASPRAQSPAMVYRRGARRYMRPRLSVEDIFWRERQRQRVQEMRDQCEGRNEPNRTGMPTGVESGKL
jgi:hypothetical protein